MTDTYAAGGADAVTLTLVQPIELRAAKTGEVLDRIDTLSFRKPVMRDLIAMMNAGAGGSGNAIRGLLCSLTGLSVTQAESLSMEDGFAAIEIVTGFLPAGLKTGPTGGPS